MDEKTQDLKGRAKEAAGALTNDDDLKREGKTDQGAAGAKSKVGEVKDRLEEGLEKGADAVKRGVDHAVDRGRD